MLFFSALFFIFPPFVLPFFHFPSFLGRFSYTFISLASPVRNRALPIISGNIGCHSHQQLQPPLDSELVSPKGTQDMKTQIAGELRSALVTQSCLTLCSPMDCSLPGSSVHGIFQARILEWAAISSSKGSSCPRDQTQVSYMADISLLSEPPRKVHIKRMISVSTDWHLSMHRKVLNSLTSDIIFCLINNNLLTSRLPALCCKTLV